jgi:glutamate racemase
LTGQPLRIGVFDSGFGGLTVLRALLPRLPDAEFVYLGDTARLPYGSKSQATVARYAAEAANFLESRGAGYLVIACNTASALALDAIQSAVAVPVLGVIEAGAESADLASRTRNVLVLATDATVQSHAYARACGQRGLQTIEKACPLLVPLIEEGWIDHAVTRQVLAIYLEEAMQLARERECGIDTVLLGCTHYPLLRHVLRRMLPEEICILDSAETAAERAHRQLHALGMLSGVLPDAASSPPRDREEDALRCRFFATDSTEKFRVLGSRFLGQPIARVRHIDLGG